MEISCEIIMFRHPQPRYPFVSSAISTHASSRPNDESRVAGVLRGRRAPCAWRRHQLQFNGLALLQHLLVVVLVLPELLHRQQANDLTVHLPAFVLQSTPNDERHMTSSRSSCAFTCSTSSSLTPPRKRIPAVSGLELLHQPRSRNMRQWVVRVLRGEVDGKLRVLSGLLRTFHSAQ